MSLLDVSMQTFALTSALLPCDVDQTLKIDGTSITDFDNHCLLKVVDSANEDIASSFFWSKGTVQYEIEEIARECNREGWGGNGTLPVSALAVKVARDLISNISVGFDNPSVSPEVDGGISLEWYKSSNNLFSISCNVDGSFSYLAVINGTQTYGVCTDLSMSGYQIISDFIKKLPTDV